MRPFHDAVPVVLWGHPAWHMRDDTLQTAEVVLMHMARVMMFAFLPVRGDLAPLALLNLEGCQERYYLRLGITSRCVSITAHAVAGVRANAARPATVLLGRVLGWRSTASWEPRHVFAHVVSRCDLGGKSAAGSTGAHRFRAPCPLVAQRHWCFLSGSL